MTSRNIALAAGALICVLSAPVVAQGSQDWVDIKDPKELRALHSNKTFRSTYGGVHVVEHYRADGKGLVIYAGQPPIPRTWEIKGNDQVCVTDTSGTFCKRFQRHKKNRDEYVSRSEPSKSMRVIRVEDGIPQF
jgi:hypothetical protein